MLTDWQEFTKVGPCCAISVNGFRVVIEMSEWQVTHTDKSGRVSFFYELVTDPVGLLLYLDDRESGVDRLDRAHAYKVLAEIAAALRFLGYRTETSGDFPQDRQT